MEKGKKIEKTYFSFIGGRCINPIDAYIDTKIELYKRETNTCREDNK